MPETTEVQATEAPETVTESTESTTPVVEGQPDQTQEEKVETQTPTDQQADDKAEKPETHESHDERRWKRLLRERAEAQAERDAYKVMIDRMGGQPQGPAGQVNQGQPEKSQYANDADYIRDLAAWHVQQQVVQAQQVTQQQTVQSQFLTKEAQVKAEIPDYDEVIAESADVPLKGHLVEAVLTSDVGPRLRYYLAQNPEKAEAFNAMSPTKALTEIGKIEARIEAEVAGKKGQPAKVTKAPAPIKPIAGSGETIVDPSKMSDKQWLMHKQQLDKAKNSKRIT